MIDITNENFYEELGKATTHEGIAIVYFTAPWCGPCRMLKPTLEKLEAANEGKVTVLRVDADVANDIVQEYSIMTVPQLFFYVDGIQFDHVAGMIQKNPLQAIVDTKLVG